ncbi:MAG: AsmA family protein [Rikenellaceae bacterium]
MIRRIIIISTITILSIFFILVIGVTIAFNFVFTPEKLTPMVNEIVKEHVNSDISIGKVELRFFSTFPRFSAKIDSIQIKQEIDSLPNLITAQRCVVAFNPLALLDNKIKVSRLHLEKADINFIIDSTYTSLDIFASETDTTVVDSLSVNPLNDYQFEISGVQIDSSNISIDNMVTGRTLAFEDLNLELDGNLNEKLVDFDILFSWENIFMGDLDRAKGLTGVSFSINSEMNFDRDSLLLTLSKANININEIALTTEGTLQADSTKTKLFVDLNSALTTPSLSEFLHLIPPSIIKDKRDLTTTGSVNLDLNITGEYSDSLTPNVTAKLFIEGASAKYNSRKVSLEDVNCDAIAYVNLNEPSTSYVDINKFSLSSTEIIDLDVNGKIVRLLDNPLFDVNLKSYIDFDRLTEVFPLENNITLKGSNTSNLNTKFALNDIETSNYGKIYIGGESSFDNVIISMTNDSIAQDSTEAYMHIEMNKGMLYFGENVNTGDNRIIKNASLLSSIDFSGVGLRDNNGNFIEVKNLSLLAATSFNKKTNEVTGLDVKFDVQDLNAGVIDTIDLFMKTTSAKLLLFPENERRQATIKAVFDSDSISLYEINNNSDLVLSKAGFNLDMTRLEPKVWDIDGTIGFSNFEMYSDLFPVNVSIPASTVTVTNSETITLDNTRIKIGESLFATTGSVSHLLKALFTDEEVTVEGNLTLKSRTVNVSELIEVTNQSVMYAENLTSDDLSDSSETENNTLSITGVPSGLDRQKGNSETKENRNNPNASESTNMKVATSLSFETPNIRDESSMNEHNQQRRPLRDSADSLRNNRQQRQPLPETDMILIPRGVNLTLNLDLQDVKYDSVTIDKFKGVATVANSTLLFNDVELEAIGAKAISSMMYKNVNRRRSNMYIDLNIEKVDINRIGGLLPSVDSLMPMLKSFEGIVDFNLKATSEINSDMVLDIETLKSAISLDGQQLVLMDGETFSEISSMLKFKNKDRNLIDSLSVDIIINESNVEVLPFEVVIDRYRAIIGGSQTIAMTKDYDLELNFNYNVSIMKSPLPFKAGVDVFGTLDDFDFKITKAKLKKTDFELVNTDFETFRATIK